MSVKNCIAKGVSSCVGCGLELAIRHVVKVVGEKTIIIIPPGCAATYSGFGAETAMTIPGFQGNLEMVSGVTAGNALGRLVRGAVTGEQMAQPEYKGSGMLVLEPSYKHFLVLELAPGESIIVDDGMFYCAQGGVTVKAVMQKSISSAVAGGETLFQQQLTGPGIIILESDVPSEEIDIIDLNNDVLKVDGNFAVLRSSSLDFTVERSAKTLIGSAVSGEGLVNVYRGTGQVWLAPTLKVYKTLAYASMYSTGSLNMNTSRS